MVLYYGSVEIVRLSNPFAFVSIDPFPDFAAGAGKSIIWYVTSRLPL
jgi:hypothetical protein